MPLNEKNEDCSDCKAKNEGIYTCPNCRKAVCGGCLNTITISSENMKEDLPGSSKTHLEDLELCASCTEKMVSMIQRDFS